MSTIELRNVTVRIGSKQVLRGIDLDVQKGEFMTFLGPSGCGKTTLLRTIAGLQQASGGTIVLSGTEVANGETGYHLDPSRRGLNLVFQSYALWPHMTVFDNVAFGLRIRRQHKSELHHKVMAALDKVRIGELAERYPGELSGGQQQRVAIARAIVTEPELLLLDEPLSNLDARLRVEMRAELKRLHRELGATIIYVTHDQQEALTLSSRIAVFFEGKIVQVDQPQTLYRRPATLRIADFFGNGGMDMNDVEGRVLMAGDGSLYWSSSVCSFALEGQLSVLPDEGMAVTLTIKPEHMRLQRHAMPGAIACQIDTVFPAGSETTVTVLVGGRLLTVRLLGNADYEPGDAVYMLLSAEQLNLYHGETGELLDGLRPVCPTLTAQTGAISHPHHHLPLFAEVHTQ
ncbi:ABC transporter ATP-binding protein [Paenibacillus campi]|uniref:ABC transporter ATP-binding protein n=1 Tax=Paenibacillus campi TaxID=3106031 RepID=UPI002B003087|nr:ABC transporter ATP-binding protein [Paenibacillus sp. SGZ-1009]